jgi:PncC family amidohydrolase
MTMGRSVEEKLGVLLRKRGLKLATAESCTGGLIGHRITNVPGSSDYYLGGIVAYANEVKIAQLDVPPALLARYGAVSREAVLEMAAGARRSLGADIAVSVSGIAGPGGGTDGKPVGTVWVGLSTPEGAWARRFSFPGDRRQVKAASAEAALQIVLEYLEGNRTLDSDQAGSLPDSERTVIGELIRRIKSL